jgi:hypothetical protein
MRLLITSLLSLLLALGQGPILSGIMNVQKAAGGTAPTLPASGYCTASTSGTSENCTYGITLNTNDVILIYTHGTGTAGSNTYSGCGVTSYTTTTQTTTTLTTRALGLVGSTQGGGCTVTITSSPTALYSSVGVVIRGAVNGITPDASWGIHSGTTGGSTPYPYALGTVSTSKADLMIGMCLDRGGSGMTFTWVSPFTAFADDSSFGDWNIYISQYTQSASNGSQGATCDGSVGSTSAKGDLTGW